MGFRFQPALLEQAIHLSNLKRVDGADAPVYDFSGTGAAHLKVPLKHGDHLPALALHGLHDEVRRGGGWSQQGQGIHWQLYTAQRESLEASRGRGSSSGCSSSIRDVAHILR